MDLYNGEKPILCKFCDKPFSNESYLLDHMGIHRDSNPVNYSIDNFPNELLNHERSHTGEKPFKCCNCNKYFSTKSNLMRHAKIHTEEKPLQCSICDKTFRDQGDLMAHARLHAVEKPFHCSDCDKDISNNDIFIII